MTRTTAHPPGPTADPPGTTAHRRPAARLIRPARAGRRWTVRVVGVLLVAIVVGQRLAVPAGGMQVPVTLLVAYAGAAALLVVGAVREDRLRTELFVLACGACTVAALLATWQDTPLSLSSLLLLVALYLPLVLRAPARWRSSIADVGRIFVRLMVVLAALGVDQMAAQLAGIWTYADPLERLPPQYLLAGYNTSIPVAYGSDIVKSNALVFLEPSFFSQYCALAIVIGLLLRAPVWQIALLAVGLVTALSGTGLLLLGAGVLLLMLRRPSAIRPGYVLAAAAAAAVAVATPAGEMLAARSGEATEPGSSGYLRFVQPYLEVARGLAEQPSRYLVGAGPGTAERVLESGRGRAGEAVVYTIAPKLAFEYGLIAAAVFLLFLVVVLFRRQPLPALPGSLFVMLTFLSGSLLQPHTVLLAWLLAGMWGGAALRRGGGPGGHDPPAAAAGGSGKP